MRKPIFITLLTLLTALVIALGTLFFSWSKFQFQPMLNSTVTTDHTELEKVSVLWLDRYFAQFKGWRVPPGWQAKHAQIDSMEPLGDGFIQINYSVYSPRFGEDLINALHLYPADEEGVYQNQVVIRWVQSGTTWTVAEEMRPAAWQIAYSPELQAERESLPDASYRLPEGAGMTYCIVNETLYVTYDGGETLVEVPDGYEKVCNDGNGRYHELLPDNGFLVTPDLTGFVTYTGGCAHLLFSRDMGASWQEIQICNYGYWGKSFLSLTETGVYAAFPTDRGLGNDDYSIYFSSDLAHWERIPLSGHTRNFTCVFWPQEGVGYLSGCEIQYADGTTKKNTFFMTQNNGESYETMEYPIEESFVSEYGYYPFDTVEKMYVEDGITYMVVGQGEDGDFYENSVRVSALYQSPDGINFTFVQTIDNTRPLAG